MAPGSSNDFVQNRKMRGCFFFSSGIATLWDYPSVPTFIQRLQLPKTNRERLEMLH